MEAISHLLIKDAVEVAIFHNNSFISAVVVAVLCDAVVTWVMCRYDPLLCELGTSLTQYA